MATIAVNSHFELVDLDSLTPTEGNPQQHEVERMKVSIREHGFVVPLIINEDSQIIGGHGRIKAVRELIGEGFDLPGNLISVVRGNYTEHEVKMLLLALNNTEGKPDPQALAEFVAGWPVEDLQKATFDSFQIEDLQQLVESFEDTFGDIGDYNPPTPDAPLEGDEPKTCPNCGHILTDG